MASQKLVTLKNGKSRTSGRRHSLYTSIPSFNEKDLHVRSCSAFNKQLFLCSLSNYGVDVSQRRARAALCDSVSTKIRKKSCRNTKRYSNGIQERSSAAHTTLAFPRETSSQYSCSLNTEHERTCRSFSSKLCLQV